MGARQMNKSKLINQAGFTLMEMIILVFLFAVLMLGLMNIFDWQIKVYNLEQAEMLATGSARVAMNNLNLMLVQGSSIVAQRTINGTDYTTGGSSIIVQLPAYDVSGNLIAATYDYVVFTASGTNLTQVMDLAANSARRNTTKTLSDKIQSFALTYNNADPTSANKVTIDLTTRAYYRGNKFTTVSLNETIFLRNR